jgi:hypothetical protein
MKDETGRVVYDIQSTIYNDKDNPIVGVISPVEADILGKVLAAYVSSDQFKADWSRIAEQHLIG